MSYMSRVWMAASVAVVQGHTDQGFKWNSGLGPLHSANKGLSSTGKLARSRPFSGIPGSDVGHLLGGNRRQQADESLQKVMYLNCWSQS
uniref:Uncharacterized protein n=1 Tax=Nelumbo nucifera TaxID=4432 RepID=A0A822Y092_NELNU|nr:TPA_asm: hypothetical protein HUJ06_024531 [Nelumbo nucifera]